MDNVRGELGLLCRLPISLVGRRAGHKEVVSIQGLKESNSPRLQCYVASAIVLVIVNLRHLPGGISHSSNKFHTTNHRERHR